MPSSETLKHSAKQNGTSIKAKVNGTELTFSSINNISLINMYHKNLFGVFDRMAKDYD